RVVVCHCARHGDQLTTVVRRPGAPWPAPVCPLCRAEAEAAERDDERMIRSLTHATRDLTLLLDANPTVDNPVWTFDSLKPETDEEAHHLKACKAFAEHFLERERARAAAKTAAAPDWQSKNGLGLLLQGHYGTGKSHLAAAIKRTVDGLGIGAVLVSHAQLLNTVLEKKISVGELRRHAGASPLLIIEELGAGVSDSDWNRSRLCEVIDARVAAGRPTVYVTNLTPKELSAALGERIISRIRGSVYRLAFTGRDRRTKPVGDALDFF
ncbi:MAG: hypothetical protein ACI4SY_02130, partial [Sutterella sp.]